MKPRARRMALVTAAAGCLVIAGLVAFNWSTVRDHAEAWWFVGTRETRTVSPGGDEGTLKEMGLVYQQLANRLACPVIFDPAMPSALGFRTTPSDDPVADARFTLRMMRVHGWRILEQRFPRRAYVITRYAPDFELEPKVISP